MGRNNFRRSKFRFNFFSSLSLVQILLLNCSSLSQEHIPQRNLFRPNAGKTSAPPNRRNQFCCGSCSSLSQEQILLRKLFLPITVTNSAEEIVPPYRRYKSRCTIVPPSVPAIGTCTIVPPYRIVAEFVPAIGRNNLAAEFEHAIGRSGSCTCSSAEFVSAIGRNNFRSGICTCDREEQLPQRNFFLRKLFLPIAGTEGGTIVQR